MRRELDIADMIAAQVDMHQAGDLVVIFGVLVELDTLNQRGGAVAYADDCYTYFTAFFLTIFISL